MYVTVGNNVIGYLLIFNKTGTICVILAEY